VVLDVDLRLSALGVELVGSGGPLKESAMMDETDDAVITQVVDVRKPDGKKMLGVIDKMFHSWLVSHDMASDEQGYIYHRNKNGDLGEKLAGTEVETFKTLLEDPNTGFQTTIDKIDPNIQIGLIWAPPEMPEGPSPGA